MFYGEIRLTAIAMSTVKWLLLNVAGQLQIFVKLIHTLILIL